MAPFNVLKFPHWALKLDKNTRGGVGGVQVTHLIEKICLRICRKHVIMSILININGTTIIKKYILNLYFHLNCRVWAFRLCWCHYSERILMRPGFNDEISYLATMVTGQLIQLGNWCF